MAGLMFKQQIGPKRYPGLSITFHVSWLLLLPLGISVLALGPLAAGYSWPPLTRWLLAVAAVLLMAMSVLLHEGGHLVMAVVHGLPIRQITFYPFGGVAHMGSLPVPAVSFIQMVLAGPLFSLLQAGIWLLAWWLGEVVIFLWLAQFNLLLGLLNLLPASQLDGGRLIGLLQHYCRQPQLIMMVKFLASIFLALSFTLSGGMAFITGLFLADPASVVGGIMLVLTGLLVQEKDVQTTLVCTPVQVNRLAQTVVAQLLSPQAGPGAGKDLYASLASGPRLSPGFFSADTSGPLGQIGRMGSDRLAVATLQPWVIYPGTSLLQALHTLDKAQASRLLVVEDCQIISTLSHHQILQHLQKQEASLFPLATNSFILLKSNESHLNTTH